MTIALTDVQTFNLGAGFRVITAKATPDSSYDATNGEAFSPNLDTYGSKIEFVSLQGAYAKADVLIKADYVNDDY